MSISEDTNTGTMSSSYDGFSGYSSSSSSGSGRFNPQDTVIFDSSCSDISDSDELAPNGVYLKKPKTNKDVEYYANDRMKVATATMQGWRAGMEDAHNVVLDFAKKNGMSDFFGIYDGHAGDEVAKLCADKMPKTLKKSKYFKREQYEKAMKQAFIDLDEAWFDELGDSPSFKKRVQGTTATCALVTEDIIYVANAGDSRAVVCEDGKAVPLSFDHKPENSEERDRIEACEGYFVENDRINGSLAMSRSIGDALFKAANTMPHLQPVIALPEIISHEVTDETEFLIIACDGIWEVLSNKQVVVGVRKMLRDGHDVVTVCEALLDRCLAPSDTGVEYGRDNMSIILVVFHRGSSNIGVATSADSSSADGSSAASYGGASSSAGSSKASFRSLELLPEYSGSG